MRLRAILAAVAMVSMMAAASAQPAGPGEWGLDCPTDAMTDKQVCMLGYLAEGPRKGVYGTLVFVWRPDDGRLILAGSMTRNYKCADRPVMLRVDKKKAVTFNASGQTHYLVGEDAEAMARQFRAGATALFRVHGMPNCGPHDMPVTLGGFTAAWNEFMAAGK